MKIRPEKPEDKSRIATLIANTYMPEGADIIEKTSVLRSLSSYSSALSLVEESANKLNAFALFTPVEAGEGKAVFLAPVAFDISDEVFIFADFLRESMAVVKAEGFRYVFVQGSGEELKPLGFDYAADKGFKHHAGNLMVCDLGSGDVLSGAVKLPDVLEK